jgi:hypothetical protein
MQKLQQQLDELRRKVDFNSYDITVKELISLVEDRTIDIAPEYQRQFRWDKVRQSQLAESIFLGIPIPNLFMATNEDGTWELIDGVQRLSSLIHLAGNEMGRSLIGVDAPLVFTDLQKLSEFNGKKFLDLPKAIQLGFLMKPLKVTTLTDKSDLSVRFDLFERLNTGGVSLTDQEIRSCVYRGKFNAFLKDCASNNSFLQVVRLNSRQIADATDEEFVLKFFAYLNNYRGFTHSVVDFLNDYMYEATKSFNYEKGEAIFKKTFSQLSRILPEGITRGRTTTPTNLYEAIAVGAALVIKSGEPLSSNSVDWIASDEMKALTTGATNSRTRVAARIEYARDKFISDN